MAVDRRFVALAVAGFFIVMATAQAATTQLNVITNSSPGHAQRMTQFDSVTSAVGDFDGDGKMELVVQNDNQYMYVLSGTTSVVLAEIRPDMPAGWPVRPINDPVAADVDGDGRTDIVVVTSAATVCVYSYASGSSTTSMSFTKRWCQRMDAYDGGGAAADAGAAVADVNGDGKMEIFSNTEKKGLFAYNWDGTVRWSLNEYGGNAGPLVTDLTNDGVKEVIFFGDGGEVRVRDANTGVSRWTFWAINHVKPASIPVSGNAADLDGDGKLEVVFIARDAHDAIDYSQNHFMLFVLSSSGALKWKAQPSWGTPLSYTHPVLADITGDGKKEIIAMDWNTIGHKPGNWEVVGTPHVFAYRHDGTLLWVTETKNSWSNDDIAVGDVDSDGVQEVIAVGGWNEVWYLDGRTGAKEAAFTTGGYTALRGPVIGDFAGDDKLSWAVSSHASAAGGAFYFYHTDAPCAGAFLSWHGEGNCGGGSGGGGTPPPPPPPPPATGFAATITPRAANEWWVQANVVANQPLSGVAVSLNGGAWTALALQSWGDWTKSFRVVSGTIVQFRATSTGGGQALSQCYQWTSMANVACGGGSPPPPSGSFAASFVNVRGNNWWIESDVLVTGGSLAGVDARVNGGTWAALTLQGWGSWAASRFAPSGATVEFRARATDGQTAQSAPYSWPPA